MRSPRFLRPHGVTIVNLMPEIDRVKEEKETILNHVTVRGKHHTKVEDIDVSNRDGVVVTIDCTDVEEDYIPAVLWDEIIKTNPKEPIKGWTVHDIGDYLIFGSIRYSIVGFKIRAPFGRIEFMELLCQRT